MVLMPKSSCTMDEAHDMVVRAACNCVSAGTCIFTVHSSRKMLWPIVLQKADHDHVRVRLANNIARSGLGHEVLSWMQAAWEPHVAAQCRAPGPKSYVQH